APRGWAVPLDSVVPLPCDLLPAELVLSPIDSPPQPMPAPRRTCTSEIFFCQEAGPRTWGSTPGRCGRTPPPHRKAAAQEGKREAPEGEVGPCRFRPVSLKPGKTFTIISLRPHEGYTSLVILPPVQ